MQKKMSVAIVAAAILELAFSTASIAKGDEVLKFRIVTHATSVQAQDVGDVDGHALGLARQSGLAFFPDGSVGTTYFTATNDFTKGAGTYLTYYNLTLKDGSVLWFKANGTAQPDGTTTIFPETAVSVLRGTGRFEGAKGDGTLSGMRISPLAVGADLYVDVIVNLRK
ncbi:hypothetical protein [Bradyrhizobium erythrophlei]|uniref:Allene oxide cyclase barrel-like domain-containing protein n=1 Tax=Bradyrhizobium erythrophlei TaxID=1437360 RepID=A0A1M7U4X2_9BRAD|nr:hypothetical protein [Bradyrhizobium erythrophlei]SHN78003.1 hypothetical protein SAMN05444170_3548 [Bradyrhizobium erythrophlei]